MATPASKKWIIVNNEGDEVSEDEPSNVSSEYVTLDQDGACSYHHDHGDKRDASEQIHIASSLMNTEPNLPALDEELLTDSLSSISGDTLSSIAGDTLSLHSEVVSSGHTGSKSSSDCDSVDTVSIASSFLDVSSVDTATTFDSESNSEKHFTSDEGADGQDLLGRGAVGGNLHYEHPSLPETQQSKLVLVLRPRRQLSSGSSDSDSDFVRLDNSSCDDGSDSELQSSNASQHAESDDHHDSHAPLEPPPPHREDDALMPVLRHFHFFGHREADFDDNDDLDGDDETESVAEDDRIESDQSDMAPAEDDDDSVDLSFANVGLNQIDLPTGPVVRQYVHRPNNDLNITLDHVVGMVVILVVGIAIGHGIGWTLEFSYEKELLQHELALTKQQRDDLVINLNSVRAKLLHEETEKEMINRNNRMASLMMESSLRLCNKELYSVGFQLGIHTINDPFEDCPGCPLNLDVSNYSEAFRIVKDELNKLQVENDDLRSVIGQMRYAQHPGNQPDVHKTVTNEAVVEARGPTLRTCGKDADTKSVISDSTVGTNTCVDLTANITALNQTVLALRRELDSEFDRVVFWRRIYSEQSSELHALRRLNASIEVNRSTQTNKSYHDCLMFLNITLRETMSQSQELADDMQRMILKAWHETSTLAASNVDIAAVKNVVRDFVKSVGETAGEYFTTDDNSKESENMNMDSQAGDDDGGSAGGFTSWIPSFDSKSAEPDENNNYDNSRSVWSASVKKFLNNTRESMTEVSKQIQEKWHQLRNLSEEIMESTPMSTLQDKVAENIRHVKRNVKENFLYIREKIESTPLSTLQEKVSENIRHVKRNVKENLQYIREKIQNIRGKHKKDKSKDAGYSNWAGKSNDDKRQFERELTDIILLHFNELQADIEKLDQAQIQVMSKKQFEYLIEDIDDLKADMEMFFGRQRGKSFAQTWLYCQRNWLKQQKKRYASRVSHDCQWAMFDWQLPTPDDEDRTKHMWKKGDKKFSNGDDDDDSDKYKKSKQYSIKYKQHRSCKSKGDCHKLENQERYERRQSHPDRDGPHYRKHAKPGKCDERHDGRCIKHNDDHHGDKVQYKDKSHNYHGKYPEKLKDATTLNREQSVPELGGCDHHNCKTKDEKTCVEEEVNRNLSEDHLQKIGSWYFRGMTWRDGSGRHPGDHSWFLRHMKERSKYHTLNEYMLDEKANWVFERAHRRQFRRGESNSRVFGTDD